MTVMDKKKEYADKKKRAKGEGGGATKEEGWKGIGGWETSKDETPRR